MNLCRIVVKCLAVVVGVFGAGLALGSLSFLAYFAFGVLPEKIAGIDKDFVISYLALVALFGGLGYYFLRTAWKHLRRPDLKSAIYVSGTFCFILGICLLTLVRRISGGQKSPDHQDPPNVLALELGVIVSVYLLHRLVLTRLAARAFPAGEAPVTPATISAA